MIIVTDSALLTLHTYTMQMFLTLKNNNKVLLGQYRCVRSQVCADHSQHGPAPCPSADSLTQLPKPVNSFMGRILLLYSCRPNTKEEPQGPSLVCLCRTAAMLTSSVPNRSSTAISQMLKWQFDAWPSLLELYCH